MKTKTVKISDDQLTLTVDGIEYEAEHAEPFCDDCHLNNNEQCSVGLHQSYCYPHVRKDSGLLFGLRRCHNENK